MITGATGGLTALDQSGIRYLVVLEGVNDLGAASSGTTVANALIAAFGGFVDMAHARNIRVYGMPILPFGKNTAYFTADRESGRQMVNNWIRTGGKFDGVIDLDPVVRDPQNAANLASAYDSGDGLHLNPVGYQKMADAIDLTLFTK